ncbi:hypothetical protein [Streptomyces filamentosus]|uniref:hypothetical protein n=1 Tax=Streptomyces filamentosus TaxID=67294 RepID=UPI0037D23F96
MPTAWSSAIRSTHTPSPRPPSPAPQNAPVPPTIPDPAPAFVVAPGGRRSSTRWAVAASLGLAVTALVLHQIPGLVPIADAVGSFAGSIAALAAVFFAWHRR